MARSVALSVLAVGLGSLPRGSLRRLRSVWVEKLRFHRKRSFVAAALVGSRTRDVNWLQV